MRRFNTGFCVYMFRRFSWFRSMCEMQWHLIGFVSKQMNSLFLYVNVLVLPLSSCTSIFGFVVLVSISLQVLSGFYLAWYYIPEPGLVIELREEMFEETRYGYEVFNMHVRGVDVVMIIMYLHILKKFFLKNYITYDSEGWLIGGYAFFWFHYIVGLGICLSASHLSDLTLTIAANVYWSLLNNTHDTYYFIFTNKHLNTDELIRLTVLHYLSPWYFYYLVQLHTLYCHENWDSDSDKNVYEDRSVMILSWYYDAFLKEFSDSWQFIYTTFMIFFWHYFDINPVQYFFFERWNISELDEIRFYGVAPHWYFRPYMGLLTIAPTHFEGIMWLVLYFLLLSSAPLLFNYYMTNIKDLKILTLKDSYIQWIAFLVFMSSLFSSASILPCGRYYYDDEASYVGNTWLKYSYQYIYWYLGFLIHCFDLIEALCYQLIIFIKLYFKDVKKMFFKFFQ